jgi:hypothetical protein
MKTAESALKADVEITAREFNKRHEWDINAAIDLAKEVLTDANAHQEVRYLTHGEELADALRQLLERSHSLDQSPTHDGLLNCEAIARAREALRNIARP